MKQITCLKLSISFFRIHCFKMTENSIHMALKESMMAKRMAEVKKLIRNGADLSERNENLPTPLHVAISQGFEDIAEILIKKLTVKMLNTICGSGLTPLYLAVWRNDFKIVQLLLQHGASAIRDSFVSDLDLRSPLQVAFHLKNYKMINLLLEYIPEVSQSEASEIKKLSLEWAVEQEYIHIVKWIVQKVGRYISNERKRHVLKWVKSPKIAEALLKKFHDGSSVNFGTAVQFEMYGIMEHFIQNDPNIMNHVDPFGNTPLLWAAYKGNTSAAKILIYYGAEINAKSNDGDTPLMLAISRGHFEVVNYLYKSGASMTERNFDGLTPLEVALKQRDKGISFRVVVMCSLF